MSDNDVTLYKTASNLFLRTLHDVLLFKNIDKRIFNQNILDIVMDRTITLQLELIECQRSS